VKSRAVFKNQVLPFRRSWQSKERKS